MSDAEKATFWAPARYFASNFVVTVLITELWLSKWIRAERYSWKPYWGIDIVTWTALKAILCKWQLAWLVIWIKRLGMSRWVASTTAFGTRWLCSSGRCLSHWCERMQTRYWIEDTHTPGQKHIKKKQRSKSKNYISGDEWYQVLKFWQVEVQMRKKALILVSIRT